MKPNLPGFISFPTLCFLLTQVACGGAPVAPSGGSNAQVASSSGEIPEDHLPSPGGGVLWADGFGDTQTRAVQDAKRGVSEQITSEVTAVTEARTSESTGKGVEQSADMRLTSKTAFEHAELIKVIGFERKKNGWAARAVLRKSELADVYEKEIEAHREQLSNLKPVVDRAITSLDASILLSASNSPGAIIAQMRRKAQILKLLGAPTDLGALKEAKVLEKRASVLRKAAVLRVKLAGKASDGLKRATLEEVGRRLAKRGCRLTEAPHGQAKAGVVAADFILKVAARNHREDGVAYRYLGFELSGKDARNGRNVFRYSAMPDFVHGGGSNPAQADAAVARRLKKKLDNKAKGAFDGLICR